MKKYQFITLLVIGIFLSTSLFAQKALKKGSYSLTGAVTYTSSKNNNNDWDTESTTIMLTPGISYFVADRFAVGIDLTYAYFETTFKHTEGGDVTHISRPYEIGPVARYYFPGTSVYPFIEGSYFYSNSIEDDSESKGFSVAGGINLFLSNSVALEPFVQYSKRTVSQGDQEISQTMAGIRINYFIIK